MKFGMEEAYHFHNHLKFLDHNLVDLLYIFRLHMDYFLLILQLKEIMFDLVILGLVQ